MSNRYRICTKCAVHHYENCDTCFGFGVENNGKLTPIIAAAAMGYEELPEWVPCPECNSTPKGLPKNAKV